jgi:hypothetical protein
MVLTFEAGTQLPRPENAQAPRTRITLGLTSRASLDHAPHNNNDNDRRRKTSHDRRKDSIYPKLKERRKNERAA